MELNANLLHQLTHVSLIFVLSCIACGCYYHIYKSSIVKTPLFAYLSLYFLTNALALLNTSVRFLDLANLGNITAAIFYIVGAYALKQTLLVKYGQETKLLIKSKEVYLVIAFTAIVLNLINKIESLHELSLRLLALTLITGYILLPTLIKKQRDIRKSSLSDKIVNQMVLYMFIIFSIILLFLLFSKNPENLAGLVTSFQVINTFLFAITFSIAVMLETINSVYQSSIRDDLTGLYNRDYFTQYISNNKNKDLEKNTIAFVDIDLLKKINDTYGHHTGDFVIKHTGKIINKKTEDHGICARFGGEEFAIFFNSKEKHEAIEAVEKIREDIAALKVNHDDSQIQITASMGVTSLSEEDSSIDAALKRADNALYSAKKSGRNKVVVSNSSKQEQ